MQPRIYTQKEHNIPKEKIDKDALFIISELKRYGYTAYIVGGSIRDLLLGYTPKDFDISTSARPEEIKKIFQRRCLIIGKRFRLAHLRFGSSVIETSTFRSGDTENDDLITRDNCWGSEEEDVVRRDFTMNALFYDPESELLLDYINGVEDISKRLLRTIGDPIVRFRQDPVRMIRMLKFLARFDLSLDPIAEHAIEQVRDEIQKSAPARIYEEIMKMMESGCSNSFFKLLKEYNFLHLLLPFHSEYLKEDIDSLLFTYLQATDQMILSGHKDHFDRSVTLAILLFPILEYQLLQAARTQNSALRMGHILHLINTLVHEFSHYSFPHFPKKLLAQTATLLVHQFRLTPLKGSPKFSLHFPSPEEFKNSLLLLSIRASIDPWLTPIWNAWKQQYEKRAHPRCISETTPLTNPDIPSKKRRRKRYIQEI